MIHVYVKGLCEPNPDGPMAWAFTAVDPVTGEIRERQLGHTPPVPPAYCGQKRATNFIAEYGAILRAVQWLQTQPQPATIYTSLSTVRNRLQRGQVYDDTTTQERMIAKVLETAAGLELTWSWVPTEYNPANLYAQTAYRQGTGKAPTNWAARRQSGAA